MTLYNHLLKIVLLYLLLAVLTSISIPIYAKSKMEYYDTTGTKTNYLGYRVFMHKIPSTKIAKYIYNNWNYYIVYKNKENKIKKYQYLKNGNIIFHEIYNYNTNKKLKQIKTYVNFNLISTLYIINKYKTKKTFSKNSNHIIRHFNKKGQLIKSLHYNKNKYLLGYTIFKYNTNGKPIKQTYYNPVNRLIQYKKMIYNNKNQKIKTKTYNSNNQLVNYYNYYYNHKGLVERKEKYNSNKKLVGYSEYEYNKGSLRYILNYDNKGNIIIR